MPVSTPAHWAPTYLCGICGRPAGGLSEPDPVPPSAAQDLETLTIMFVASAGW